MGKHSYANPMYVKKNILAAVAAEDSSPMCSASSAERGDKLSELFLMTFLIFLQFDIDQTGQGNGDAIQ